MQMQNSEDRIMTNIVKKTIIHSNTNFIAASNLFVLQSGYMRNNKEKHTKNFRRCKSSNHTHTQTHTYTQGAAVANVAFCEMHAQRIRTVSVKHCYHGYRVRHITDEDRRSTYIAVIQQECTATSQ
jgi:hypothetical protein